VADEIKRGNALNRSVSFWPAERVIYFNGELKNIAALNIERAVRKAEKDKTAPLYFIINSRGGDYYAGLKIKVALENSGLRVITVVFGQAFSGGMFLSQIGKKRLITERSHLRFHMACHILEKETSVNASELLSRAQELLTIDAMQLYVFTRRGRPIKKIFRLFREDAGLNAREAIKLNLADEIIPEPKDIPDLISYFGNLKK
jgi:ATP-dependent protease ClpP protease subunit